MGLHSFAYALYALAQALLAVWGFLLWRRDREIGSLALLLPIATVWYDNLIIVLGSFIGPGPLLEALTVPRFVGHALITPIWIIAGISLAIRVGAFPKRAHILTIGSWLLYALMVAVGIFNEIISFKGELIAEGGVLYYTNAGRVFTPPPPSLVMLVVVLICGAIVLWKTRWPWMLLGAASVPLAQAIPGDGVAFLFINSSEVIMSLSLIVTLAFVQRRSKRLA